MVGDQYAGQTGPCARCGQMVTIPAGTAGGPAPYPAPPRRGSAGVIIGIIAGILLLCGGGVAVVGWLGFRAFGEAQERVREQQNLNIVAISMHNFHDVYAALPSPASYDESGKPLLSWRVHLLPFLEEEHLYRQFHLDEPWDSPHNKALIPRIPAVYRMPGDTTSDGKTRLVVPVGAETMFPAEPGRQRQSAVGNYSFGSVTDGLSNTIMLLMVPEEQAVIWTKPDDWPVTPQALDAMANDLAQGKAFRVAMGDGSTHSSTKSAASRDTLRKLFDRRDGEVIEMDWQR
jgi:hypothetical protein